MCMKRHVSSKIKLGEPRGTAVVYKVGPLRGRAVARSPTPLLDKCAFKTFVPKTPPWGGGTTRLKVNVDVKENSFRASPLGAGSCALGPLSPRADPLLDNKSVINHGNVPSRAARAAQARLRQKPGSRYK
ncbi:hypothetical protein EVAR_94507_1 [Eumeta japonica]|uniref:Uncharacterized protein n=1 Tax=Eumeta variegata TaxID=151549 RepID=A0A4C1UV76_EUMVA|nr:hypothetical protein EVAR_94507_1 [Eumeta japonica]